MALAIHALIAIFYPLHEQKPFVETMRVTQLRLERRPAPPRAQARPVVHPAHVAARAQAISVKLPVLAPPRHRELAKITSRALEYAPPRSPAHAQTHALLPQVDYQATISKLRSQNDPLLGAERPVEHTTTTQKHYASDLVTSFGTSPGSLGVLTPVTSWHQDGYNYYYVRYYVQYPDGAVETGTVPWPLRYLPSSDPFALHIEHFPLPLPLPDFTLPSGTNLRPLISYCWEHRMEVSSCPIAHD